MTETRILSNHPSIQHLESNSPIEKFALSDIEIDKLFQPSQYPKFDVFELKKEEALNKYPIVCFFLSKIENWNRVAGESQNINLRT